MYTDLGYAKKRLENSLVSLKNGEPFWIKKVIFIGNTDVIITPKSVYKITFNEETGEEEEEEVVTQVPHNKFSLPISPSDIICIGNTITPDAKVEAALNEIDLSPVSLGFCNYSSSKIAAWLSRIPVRTYYKQGLGDGNISCKGVVKDTTPFNKMNMGFPNFKDLYKTIKNDYPSIEEAKKMINDKGYHSVAFSRFFSLSKDALFYKTREIGETKDFTIYPKYQYLNELFYNEVLNAHS